MKIIYPNSVGGICVIHPVASVDITQIAQLDVPKDVPYLIVEDSVIPTDRKFREAWTADLSNPTGIGVGRSVEE